MTPFELLFGVAMKDSSTEVKRIIENEIRSEFNSEREKLRNQAKDSILKIQGENRKTFNAKRKPARKYEVDDLVAISKTQFSTGSKLKSKNLGPYKVTKVKQNAL